MALLGLGLSATVSRKFLLLPMAVMGFLFQHALEGWCPPVQLFRRLGIRTQTEIESERYALKAMRGDFSVMEKLAEGKEGEERRIRELLRVVKS